jgi:hypothetical protein
MAENEAPHDTSDCDLKTPDPRKALVLYQELNEQQTRTIRDLLKTIAKLRIALVEAGAHTPLDAAE